MLSIEEIQARAREEKVSVLLVLKEKIHLVVLDYLFKAGAFNHLVFQGGTALRIVYQGVRYSEGLDFVLRKGHQTFWARFPGVLDKLPFYLERFLFFAGDIRLKTQKRTRTFQRFVLTMKINALGLQDRTQLELANVPSYENEALIVRGDDVPVSPAIRTEKPAEILADKLMAFGLRNYVKGKDIWDIHFLTAVMGLAHAEKVPGLVKKKISDYHSSAGIFAAKFKEHLLTIQEKGAGILKTEMERFLPSVYQDQFRKEYRTIAGSVSALLQNFLEGWKKNEA